ncbi:hypothetical protein A1O1_04962, partial [Capronia coronata CBS 617.96]
YTNVRYPSGITATLTLATAIPHPPFIPSPTDPTGSQYWHSAHPADGPSPTTTAPTSSSSINNTGLGTDSTDWSSSSSDPDTTLPITLPSNFNTVRIAHAVFASSAFLVFFPLGGILIRICHPHPCIVWIHAAIQTFAYVVFVVAAGLGVWMAKKVDCFPTSHTIIGLVLLSLIALVQPTTQFLHHRLHPHHPRLAVYLAHTHLWLGRVLVTLGIINGGLGFQLASTSPGVAWSRAPKVAYGVVATLVWIVYVAVLAVWVELGRGESWSR